MNSFFFARLSPKTGGEVIETQGPKQLFQMFFPWGFDSFFKSMGRRISMVRLHSSWLFAKAIGKFIIQSNQQFK